MKKERFWYIVWIEGLSWKRGEKLKSLSHSGSDNTLRMMDALRVKAEDVSACRELMTKNGIAGWVVNSDRTFIRTSYAPAGTVWKP